MYKPKDNTNGVDGVAAKLRLCKQQITQCFLAHTYMFLCVLHSRQVCLFVTAALPGQEKVWRLLDNAKVGHIMSKTGAEADPPPVPSPFLPPWQAVKGVPKL